MKTRNLLLLIGLGALGYWLWRNSKKQVTVNDLRNPNPVGGKPKEVIPAKDVTLKQPLMADDISNKKAARKKNGMRVRVRNERTIIPPTAAAPIKEEIFVERSNAIPNVYSDNIGKPVSAKIVHMEKDFENFTGDTTNIQCACKTKSPVKYRINLPQLP